MSDLPEPLTPPDCDLRGMAFMPLDTLRLLDSDLFALSTGEEFKAAVALWCKAWQQVPAGSLPDDDRILAHLSAAGARWKKIREGALRGWVKCSDGRLYHRTVAEKALEALPMRREYKEKVSSAAERKQREREDRRELFAALRAAGQTPAYDTPTRDLRQLVASLPSQPVTQPVTNVTHPVTAKTGTGTGTELISDDGGGSAREPEPVTPVTEPDFPNDLIAITAECARIAGVRHVDPGRIVAHQQVVREWLDAGLDPEADIVPAIRDALQTAPERVTSLKYFDGPIRQAKARKEAQRNGARTRDTGKYGDRMRDPVLDDLARGRDSAMA